MVATLIGASGTVIITAPDPTIEAVELPTTLVAIICTKTYEPHCKKNGDALSTVIGMLQLLAAITAGELPLQ